MENPTYQGRGEALGTGDHVTQGKEKEMVRELFIQLHTRSHGKNRKKKRAPGLMASSKIENDLTVPRSKRGSERTEPSKKKVEETSTIKKANATSVRVINGQENK